MLPLLLPVFFAGSRADSGGKRARNRSIAVGTIAWHKAAAGAPLPVRVKEALNRAAGALRQAGVESPRFEAELLLCHVLSAERIVLLRDPDRSLTPVQQNAFEALVARRARREPLPYLTGRQPFLDFELLVDPRVLIPRPETELLVEVGLRLLPPPGPEALRVIDIGTGSGAVAIGMALARPDLQIAATDLSPGALQVAAANAARLLGPEKITFFLGSGPDAAPAAWRGLVHLVVSNPPYIPAADIPELQPEVAVYEPRLALDGGSEGLDVIRQILQQAPFWLISGGALALEIGHGQAAAVREMLARAGLDAVVAHRDLSGIERVMAARWSP